MGGEEANSIGRWCLHYIQVCRMSSSCNVMFTYYRSRELTITNFALSKHLVREDEPLSDQRGSLAYISPDVLSGKQR